MLHTDVTLHSSNAAQSTLQRWRSATPCYIDSVIGTPGEELSKTACTLSL